MKKLLVIGLILFAGLGILLVPKKTLAAANNVSGRVTSTSTKAIANSTIVVKNSLGATVTQATTDSSGNYSLYVSQTGYYQLIASASYYLSQTQYLQKTSITYSSVVNFSLTPQTINGTVSGKVFDVGNQPVVQATISIAGFKTTSTKTDTKGNFSGAAQFSVETNSILVTISKSGYTTQSKTVTYYQGTTSYNIGQITLSQQVASGTFALQGFVKDSQGNYLEGAAIIATWKSGSLQLVLTSATLSASTGYFYLPNLPLAAQTSLITITASKDGYTAVNNSNIYSMTPAGATSTQWMPNLILYQLIELPVYYQGFDGIASGSLPSWVFQTSGIPTLGTATATNSQYYNSPNSLKISKNATAGVMTLAQNFSEENSTIVGRFVFKKGSGTNLAFEFRDKNDNKKIKIILANNLSIQVDDGKAITSKGTYQANVWTGLKITVDPVKNNYTLNISLPTWKNIALNQPLYTTTAGIPAKIAFSAKEDTAQGDVFLDNVYLGTLKPINQFGRLQGYIKNTGGTYVSPATVSLSSGQQLTNQSSYYLTNWLPLTEVQLTGSKDGYEPVTSPKATPVANQTTWAPDIVLGKLATVSGKVVDGHNSSSFIDQSPIGGVKVKITNGLALEDPNFFSSTTTTWSTGLYSLTKLKPGSYTVTASKDGYKPRVTSIPVTLVYGNSITLQNIIMDKKNKLSGKVFLAGGTTPAKKANVSLATSTFYAETLVDDYGNFAFTDLSGNYGLSASGYGGFGGVQVTITAGQDKTQNLTLSDSDGSLAWGIVLDTSGKKLSGAMIVFSADEDNFEIAQADENGQYIMPKLEKDVLYEVEVLYNEKAWSLPNPEDMVWGTINQNYSQFDLNNLSSEQ